jgi:excinuclease ABC subunit A
VYDAFRLLYSRIAQNEGEIFTAQHYSYNHHLGACPLCQGLGGVNQCDPEELIVATEKSIWNGAITLNKAVAYYADPNGQFMATLKEVAHQKKWDISRPWQELETEVQEIILYGTKDTEWNVTWEFVTKTSTGTQELTAKWHGLCHYINNEYQRKRLNKNIKSIEEVLHTVECPTCKGSRLKPALLQTKFLGLNIHQISCLRISDCLTLLETKQSNSGRTISAISKVVIPPVIQSLKTIAQLGLDYLSLDRSVSSISGGERQRVTLAGQLSNHLFGVTYVLDEPTIGLDEVQVSVLAKALKQMVKNGNTVVVVEHDPSFIKSADYLIEMGPEAGSRGGQVMYQGRLTDLTKAHHTVTFPLLQKQSLSIPNKTNPKGIIFGLKGANAHNLKNNDVAFYSEQITAVTGISGSGKSSLIKEVLYRSWQKNRPVNCTEIYGFTQFEEVLLIDQEALIQNRLSTPLTFTGIIEPLKALFSKTEMAKIAGLKKADFSYQSKQGKCPTCNGHGKLRTSMDFMSDIWLTCDSCNGKRYNTVVLACKWNDHTIGDILEFTVLEAFETFNREENRSMDTQRITDRLIVLMRVGLGHLILGQSGHTLSGGEAQRLKLATSMMEKRKGATLYLFDEPSTGLHYNDILPLIKVYQHLVNHGDTVVYIEHNKTLIESADRMITLGPGSGEHGGQIAI